MLAFNYDIFNENLRLTQQYCTLQLLNSEKSEAEILRSINPEYCGEKVFDFIWKEHHFKNQKDHFVAKWNIDPDKNGIGVELFETQLKYKKEVVTRSNHLDVNGRILVCEFLCTTEDGVCEAETLGFIDITDLPPIDTWFYLTKDSGQFLQLYAWIPEKFVPLVQEGIEVNVFDIFNWKE